MFFGSCVVYIYNDCHQMSQSHQYHHSRTGLRSHLIYSYDAFSYLYVSSFYFLNLTTKNLTNQIVADPGLMSLLVRELFLFESEYPKYVPIESFLFESEHHQ